jgi:hypothetical protein
MGAILGAENVFSLSQERELSKRQFENKLRG